MFDMGQYGLMHCGKIQVPPSLRVVFNCLGCGRGVGGNVSTLCLWEAGSYIKKNSALNLERSMVNVEVCPSSNIVQRIYTTTIAALYTKSVVKI